MRAKELYLHTSNRIESLAERLVEVSRAQPLESILDQETVMTLNPGMARWLRFEIAKSLGVCFGWDFPFPGKLFQKILSGFESDHPEGGVFDEHLARWALFDLLDDLEDVPHFGLLRRYCEKGSARRFQLANRLARLFDQYLLYRPETIVGWESDPTDTDWQGELWRRLLPRVFDVSRRPKHIARIWQLLRAANASRFDPDTSVWPNRLSVFGVSSLPPLYLDLLDVVSYYRPVHIYLLQPSDLYWADLKSNRQIVRASQRAASTNDQHELEFEGHTYEIGNPLLPSFGKQGQAFLDLILDKDPIQDDESFQEPSPGTQLNCLQSDLFTLENRSDKSPSNQPQYPFSDYDGTLQFHNCSSPRREIETLWDYLVEYFANHPGAQANEVLVMAPDIQDYAGHIDSVFNGSRYGDPSIPFSIADQSGSQESAFLSGLIEYLELPQKRATASEIANLLNLPITREAFRFSESDANRIISWIRDMRIVWGWDDAHRESFGAFPASRSTWSEFRTRLAAGMAYGNESQLLPSGLSPYCEIEGESTELAGRFLEFLNFLEEFKRDCDRSDTIAYWNEQLCALLDRLKPKDENEQNRYQAAIELIQEALPSSASIQAPGKEAISCVLQALESSSPSTGYLSGRVTFCSLKPMRSIPAKAICLLGMNSDNFPRKSIRPQFDLLSISPRSGDRNMRDEDKQFFLETILSARERLFVSYQGISPVNDNTREPSIVVAELIDYLKAALSESEFSKIQFNHKRQSYDPEYFEGGQLFTYSKTRTNDCNAYIESEKTSADPAPTPPPPKPKEIDDPNIEIDSLIRFYKFPQRTFVESTLGARFPQQEDELLDIDPLGQDPLSRYEIRKRFAQAIRSGEPVDSIDPALIASIKLLPPGHLEQLSYESLLEEARTLERLWRDTPVSEKIEILRVDISGPDFRLSGPLRRNTSSGNQYLIHPGKMNAKTHLESWIQHLIANSIEPTTTQVFSLVDSDKSIALAPSSESLEILGDLIESYRQGLENPIPFFPQLSFEALETLEKRSSIPSVDGESETLLKLSQSLLEKDRHSTFGQPKYPWDSYILACFGENYVLDEKYVSVSQEIWGPFQQSRLTEEAVH